MKYIVIATVEEARWKFWNDAHGNRLGEKVSKGNGTKELSYTFEVKSDRGAKIKVWKLSMGVVIVNSIKLTNTETGVSFVSQNGSWN